MSSARSGLSGAALAFDFGLRRIGVASGHSLTQAAAPLATVSNGEPGPDWRAIEALISAYKPAVLVVGNPYNADGSPGAMSAAAGRFAQELARRVPVPVELVDERGSSREASAELKERRAAGTRRRRVQRADIDSVAAAIILERWLRGE
jgi:putative holliday junction resolvase